MLFRQGALAGIARGEITLAFRRWRKAPPKDGATVRTAIGVVELSKVQQIADSDISERDARKAGAATRAELLDSLRSEGELFRVHLRLLGPDPRQALREEPVADTAALQRRLEAMDKRSERPWTRRVLQLIADEPGVVSHTLAAQLGMERVLFKRRVRGLKELGLTESLEVGYRLSTRGQSFLKALAKG